MARLIVLSAAAIVLSLAGLCGPVLADVQGFASAVAAYNSREYSKALTQFQSINRSHPNDAPTHYYMGLCYQYLSQVASAKDEYTWVYTYSSDQTLRYNSYQALQQLQQWSTHRAYLGQGNRFQRGGRTIGRRSSGTGASAGGDDQQQTGKT